MIQLATMCNGTTDNDPPWWVGVSRKLPGAEGADYSGEWKTATGGSDRQFYYYIQTANIKHIEHCVVSKCNAFRMSSSNLSFTTKSCTCASITHLAQIIFYTYCMKQHYTTTTLGIHYSYILERLYECNTATVMFKSVACQVSSTALWDLRQWTPLTQVKSESDDFSRKKFSRRDLPLCTKSNHIDWDDKVFGQQK